jgi:hypothetical protein
MYVLIYFAALMPFLLYVQFGFSLFQSFQQNTQQFKFAIGISVQPELLQLLDQQNAVNNIISKTYENFGINPEKILHKVLDKPYVEHVIKQIRFLPHNS